MDNAVLKLYHCEPKRCPLCLNPMSFGLLDAPVVIPCPFSNGHNTPHAFLIGSQQGPMFISESNASELHVGITNSKGMVYNYTLPGVQRDDHGWEQCITVPLAAPGEDNFGSLWDTELEQFSLLSLWSPHRFHEEREFGSCCYGFALAFINHMRRVEGKDSVSRDAFTGQHILPRIKTASKYLTVYQEISQHGFYIADE